MRCPCLIDDARFRERGQSTACPPCQTKTLLRFTPSPIRMRGLMYEAATQPCCLKLLCSSLLVVLPNSLAYSLCR